MVSDTHSFWQQPFWDEREDGIVVRLWARPGAKREAVLGVKADEHDKIWLQVSVKAAPEDGKANAALIAFLAQTLGVKRSDITQLQGAKSRQKLFKVILKPQEMLTKMQLAN